MNSQVTLEDQMIFCKRCGQAFAFTVGEQEYYWEKKISPPMSCKPCREKRKAEDAERLSRVEEAVSNAKKQTGVVVSYSEKGFGFITVDSSTDQLFFHTSALRGCKPQAIKPGVKVEFYIIDSAKKPGAKCAERVVVLAETEGAKP